MPSSGGGGSTLMDYSIAVNVADGEMKAGLARVEQAAKESAARVDQETAGGLEKVGARFEKIFSPLGLAKKFGLFGLAFQGFGAIKAGFDDLVHGSGTLEGFLESAVKSATGITGPLEQAREAAAKLADEGKRVADSFAEIKKHAEAIVRPAGYKLGSDSIDEPAKAYDAFQTQFGGKGDESLRAGWEKAQADLKAAKDAEALTRQKGEYYMSQHPEEVKQAQANLAAAEKAYEAAMQQIQAAVDTLAAAQDIKERAESDERERQAGVRHAEEAMKKYEEEREKNKKQEEQLMANIEKQENDWVAQRRKLLLEDAIAKIESEKQIKGPETFGLEELSKRLLTYDDEKIDRKKQLELQAKQAEHLESIDKSLKDTAANEAAQFTA